MSIGERFRLAREFPAKRYSALGAGVGVGEAEGVGEGVGVEVGVGPGTMFVAPEPPQPTLTQMRINKARENTAAKLLGWNLGIRNSSPFFVVSELYVNISNSRRHPRGSISRKDLTGWNGGSNRSLHLTCFQSTNRA